MSSIDTPVSDRTETKLWRISRGVQSFGFRSVFRARSFESVEDMMREAGLS